MKAVDAVGYAALLVGLVLMLCAAALLLVTATGRGEPPRLVSFSDIEITLPIGGTLTVVRGDTLTFLANLLLWYVGMFFVLVAGGRIAGVGIRVLRELGAEARGPEPASGEEG